MPGIMLTPMIAPNAQGFAPAATTAAPASGAGVIPGLGLNPATLPDNALFAALLAEQQAPALQTQPELDPLATQQQNQLNLQQIAAILQQQGMQQTDVAPATQVTLPEISTASADDILSQLAQENTDAANFAQLYTLTNQRAPEPTLLTPDIQPTPLTPEAGLLGNRDELANESLDNLMARFASVQPSAAEAQEIATPVLNLQAGTAVSQFAPKQEAKPVNENPLLAATKRSTPVQQPVVQAEQVVQADAGSKNNGDLLKNSNLLAGSALNGFAANQQPDTGLDMAVGNNAPLPATAALNAPAPASLSHPPSLAGQELNPSTPLTPDQVHLRIAQAVKTGEQKIDIQLEPANLGKIQVHITTHSDGKTSITLFAEKSDTLDMLKNDASNLQKSLADAGIKADSGSLHFAHRQPGGFAFQQQQQGNGYNSYANQNYGGVNNDSAAQPMYRVYESNRALDIMA